MPRPVDVALAEDAVVAERGLRLAPGGLERVVELSGRADDPHSPPAATCGRLDEQREAELLGCAVVERRNARLARDSLRLRLVASDLERLDSGPDPDQAGGFDRSPELGALGQEPVPRMDRVGARHLRRADVLLGVEVVGDRDGLVRAPRMERVCVVGRRDGDRRDAELPAGSEHPHRYLPPICDEQLADLAVRAHMRKTPNRVSGIGSLSAAEMPSASTRLVSSGSRMPSSQSRAVE